MTNEEAFKQLVKFKNSLLMELRNVSYHPTLDNESPIEFIYIALQALEKQVPKKLGKADFGNHKNFFDKCPNCGYESAGSHFKYCHECGQRLDWGDNHDTEA